VDNNLQIFIEQTEPIDPTEIPRILKLLWHTSDDEAKRQAIYLIAIAIGYKVQFVRAWDFPEVYH